MSESAEPGRTTSLLPVPRVDSSAAQRPLDDIEATCRELLASIRLISSSLDPSVVLETAAMQAMRLLRGAAAVALRSEAGALTIAVTHHLHVHDPDVRIAIGAETEASVRALGSRIGLDGFVGVPLVVRDGIIGFLAVYAAHRGRFTDRDEDVLGALSGQTAIAFDNALLHQSNQQRAAALRVSEERFRLAFDEAPIGVALVGLDGQFLRVNNVLCEIVGYTREELTGKTFQAITHPDDVDLDVELAGKLARGEIPRYQLAKRYLHKDGRIVDIMLSGSIVRGPNGDPVHFIAQIEDVSDRKRAEEQLRQTQERYELALAGANLGSWDWNIVSGEVMFNARWAEMRGYRHDEIRPNVESWAANVHPDDLPAVQRALEDHFAGRTPFYEAEHRVRCRSGDWIWVLDRGRVFTHASDGRPLRMVGTELDITARKQAEHEHERYMERLQTILDLAPVGIGITAGGHGWRVNERAKQLMGVQFDETTDPSTYVGGILDANQHPISYEQLPGMRALRGERIEGLEIWLLRPDGRRIPALCNAAPLPPRENEPPAAVVAFEDISTVKELERLRTEWSSIVVHDLRQPLNSINLAAGILLELTDDPAIRRRLHLQIRDSARRLGRMIQDLLDFSLLEARQLRLHREVCDLSSLTESITARLGLEDPQRPIDVELRGPTACVDVDPDRFAQILENLMTNALKYGARATPIHVVVATEGSSVSVSVTNHGEGIAPDRRRHLFERFRTLEDARRAGVKGLGLGLYITRELVEAHGGTISVDSTPGETTTFTFVLPTVTTPR